MGMASTAFFFPILILSLLLYTLLLPLLSSSAMRQEVAFQVAALVAAVSAQMADVGLLLGMDPLVPL